MNLISCEHLSKQYDERPLLRDCDFYLGEGEKVGLIGINGTGKSTLMKMIAGLEEPDAGTIVMTNGLVLSYLPQHPQFPKGATVMEAVLQGHDATEQMALEVEAKSMLTRLMVTDFTEVVDHLSGGQRKRLALVAALLSGADVLLLDEPTNHLDSEMSAWLEEYLKKYRGAMIMITHDRYFLDSVTNRIVEVDKGQLYSYKTNYSGFLALKAEREEMAMASEAKRQNILRIELAWMQRGARARSTKQKAHIARYEALAALEGPKVDATIEIASASSRLGRTTIEVEQVSKAYGERTLVREFTHYFSKGERIGFIGPNGCGKSTLMKMIAGLIAPDSGRITIGQTVKIGYYAQEIASAPDPKGAGGAAGRAAELAWMDPDKRVIDYIRDTAEYVQTDEGPVSASVMLDRFLFPPEKQYAKIGKLSGGEKRRLGLLRILMEAPNVLLLDEPTNDLDIQTLQILEDYLDRFEGIVLVVSHDRYLLDRLVTRIFAYEGDGRLVSYMGGYTDYAMRRGLEGVDSGEGTGRDGRGKDSRGKESAGKEGSGKDGRGKESAGKEGLGGENRGEVGGARASEKSWKKPSERPKFSYSEKREYETIEDVVSGLEERIAQAERAIAENSANYSRLQELMAEKQALEAELEEKMERWIYLQELAEKIEAYEKSRS